jgi:hypothetical protein
MSVTRAPPSAPSDSDFTLHPALEWPLLCKPTPRPVAGKMPRHHPSIMERLVLATLYQTYQLQPFTAVSQ